MDAFHGAGTILCVRFEFDVDVSNPDAIMRGVRVLGTSRVVVEAERHVDASLIALQMAARHGMPTDLYDRV